jgi:hypothetical protein
MQNEFNTVNESALEWPVLKWPVLIKRYISISASMSQGRQLYVRAVRNIRKSITEEMAASIACALVGARLD